MNDENIKEYLKEVPGKYTVYYKNLVTGEILDYNGNVPMMAASVIKIPILVETFRQIQAGRLKKDQLYVLEEGDKLPSCGCLNRMHAGMNLTVQDLYNLMIILSDNTATNILIRLLGGMEEINGSLAKMGYQTCRVNRLLFDSEASDKGIENYVSAAEIADMLEKMYRGELIDRASSQEMLEIMKSQRLKNKIPFYFQGCVPIAHKTGEDDGITHDVGIIFGRQPFLLCCMSNETDCPLFNRFIQKLAWSLYRETEKS
ncbi:MAG: class A beta-lactamase-related serine hydrolase [Acetatifactor sp.]|jgi:Beta-lactamase class A|nr:class A beta-lactamase-related serine hydrolase [Acetatifactor sp.]